MTEASLLVACIVCPILALRLWGKVKRSLPTGPFVTRPTRIPSMTVRCECGQPFMEAGPGICVATEFDIRCRCGRSHLVTPFSTTGVGGTLTIRGGIQGQLRVTGNLRIE